MDCDKRAELWSQCQARPTKEFWESCKVADRVKKIKNPDLFKREQENYRNKNKQILGCVFHIFIEKLKDET